MGKVAAVFPQAAIADLMTAHVELEVLLELADLRILEGRGADDVYQAPGGRGGQYNTVCSPQPVPISWQGRGFSPGASCPISHFENVMAW